MTSEKKRMILFSSGSIIINRKNRLSRIDPSGTLSLQNKYVKELKKLFNLFRMALIKLIKKDDVFGFKATSHLRVDNSLLTNANWRLLNNPEKAIAFSKWLETQTKSTLLNETENSLWNKFTEDGYKKGISKAYNDAKRKYGDSYTSSPDKKDIEISYRDLSKDQFIRSAFSKALGTEKLRLLTNRTKEEVKQVVSNMSSNMVKILVDGFTKGIGQKELIDNLVKQTKISEARASTIVRTEMVRINAEAQLDALEQLGETEIGIVAEWSAAYDDRVCSLCADMDGVILDIKDARGLIPMHPNCRCTYLPVKVDKLGRKTRERIQRKLAESQNKKTGSNKKQNNEIDLD